MSSKISQFPNATTLLGSELIPLVQSGTTVKTPVSNIFSEIRVNDVTNLTTATSLASSTNRSIYITGVINITNDIDLSTVPEITIVQGGGFNISSGKTLTLPANFNAGMAQAFFGSGKVFFSNSPLSVIPHWWYSGSGSWAPAFQSAINSGAHRICAPENVYDFGTTSVYQYATVDGTSNGTPTNVDGVAIVGLGTYHNTKIIYTGSGYALNFIGFGSDAVTSVSRLYLENIWISGNNNTTSIGALNISRTFIVDINRCQFSDFAKTTDGIILNARNTFNFQLRNSQISGNANTTSTVDGLVVGSENSNAWNTSNVQIRNCLIQRVNLGVKVSQDANVFDNLLIDNTSFGSNNGHIYADTPYIYQIVLTNNHFEDCRTGTSIALHKMTNVRIADNFSQNALNHIYLEDVNGFSVERNKIQNPISVALANDTGIQINVNSGTCAGRLSWNSINTSEITTPYNIHASANVSSDTTSASESVWSFYASNPRVFGRGNMVNRYERDIYNRMWTAPDGATWLRLMMSDRDYSETTTNTTPTNGNPFSSGATITQGAWVKNNLPTVMGSDGNKYIILGWMRLTTGTGHVLNTDWAEMRVLTGQ